MLCWSSTHYASAAALIPWEHAQGSQRGDSDKQLNWHIWHTKQCSLKQLHKTRWNRLMENSSRSRLSRNDTPPAFVSNPLWSVCVKAGSYDSHVVCPLRVFIHRQIPDQSLTLGLDVIQKYQTAPGSSSSALCIWSFLLFLHEAPFTCPNFAFNGLWIVYATYGWILAVQ